MNNCSRCYIKPVYDNQFYNFNYCIDCEDTYTRYLDVLKANYETARECINVISTPIGVASNTYYGHIIINENYKRLARSNLEYIDLNPPKFIWKL